jgi:glycosyltransferase involved in cell wall biosynthesis
MAAGTPVVAARAGALPETCGDAALLVQANDADGFADALIAAACDERDRARLIEAGRRRAAEFSWTRTARLTDAVIGEVIGRG